MMRPEDWSGLAPERDRPEGVEFDWQPEALNLTAAAVVVVRTHRAATENLTLETAHDRGVVHGAALALWCELTGMDQAAALTYAFSIADAVPPVTAVCPPF